MLRLPAIVRTVVCVVLAAWGAVCAAEPGAVPRDGPTWRTRTAPVVGPPPIEFDPREVDFGDLRPGSKAERTVIVTNTGEQTIELKSVESTCWCAAGNLSQSTLGPDESATLTVALEAGDMVSTVSRRVDLMVDGYSQPAALGLRADVHYGVRARLMLDTGSMRRGTLTLESADGEPFRVLSVNGAAPEFLDGFDAPEDDARARYSVRYDLSGAQRSPRWFVVETDRADSPLIDIPVPDWTPERERRAWSIVEPRVMLGEMEAGSLTDVVVTMRGAVGDPLEFIESVRIRPPGVLGAEVLGVRAGDGELKVRLGVRVSDEARGVVMGSLVLRAGGEEGETVLMGRVVGGNETERPGAASKPRDEETE